MRQRTAEAVRMPPRQIGLFETTRPERGLGSLVLGDGLRRQLSRLLAEQDATKKLEAAGFAPAKRVLFAGPPGTGKSSAAHALAAEMELPVQAVQLSQLRGSLMGETAAKITKVFESAGHCDGVILLDEIDAIGRHRMLSSESSAANEQAATLNTLLQELDRPAGAAFFIATTNLVEALDAALLRRFDAIVQFGPPTAEEITRLAYSICRRVSGASQVDWAQVGNVAAEKKLTHAIVVRAATRAGKDAVLSGESLTTATVLSVVAEESP